MELGAEAGMKRRLRWQVAGDFSRWRSISVGAAGIAAIFHQFALRSQESTDLRQVNLLESNEKIGIKRLLLETCTPFSAYLLSQRCKKT
jgi:hypothetical protein